MLDLIRRLEQVEQHVAGLDGSNGDVAIFVVNISPELGHEYYWPLDDEFAMNYRREYLDAMAARVPVFVIADRVLITGTDTPGSIDLATGIARPDWGDLGDATLTPWALYRPGAVLQMSNGR